MVDSRPMRMAEAFTQELLWVGKAGRCEIYVLRLLCLSSMLPGMKRLLERLRRSRIGVLLFVFCSFLLICGGLAGLLAVLDVPEESLVTGIVGTVGIIMLLLLISSVVWFFSWKSFKGLILTAFGSFIGFFYFAFLNSHGNEHMAAGLGLLFGFTILAGIFRGCRLLWRKVSKGSSDS